ncbi:MAG TPA: hypothetical protein VKB62_08220 [Streptosporangiaceae bacterium]|nr:hypothetical protein [Streptosporangiaceae bacterium]
MRDAQRAVSLLYLPAACRTAAALVAIVVLAGCAGVSAGSAGRSGPAGTEGPTRADDIPASVASSAPAAGNRAEGDALARQLLSRLTLPPGARRLAAAPASMSPGGSADSWATDLHREFLLPVPEAAAISFQRAHLPAGLQPDGTGGVTSYGPPEVHEYDWSQRTLPRGIASIELTEELAPDRGSTLVRFDAEVTWYPARPAADFANQATVSSVTVLATEFTGNQARSLVRKISSRPEIGMLVRLFNSLPGAARPLFCVPGSSYQLHIAMPGGRRLQVQAGRCSADVVTATGHARFVLWDPGHRLAALVASLIRPG